MADASSKHTFTNRIVLPKPKKRNATHKRSISTRNPTTSNNATQKDLENAINSTRNTIRATDTLVHYKSNGLNSNQGPVQMKQRSSTRNSSNSASQKTNEALKKPKQQRRKRLGATGFTQSPGSWRGSSSSSSASSGASPGSGTGLGTSMKSGMSGSGRVMNPFARPWTSQSSSTKDDVFPSAVSSSPTKTLTDIFPTKLTLLSQQKHISTSQHVTREALIDTIFDVLFPSTQRSNRPKMYSTSAFGDESDSGTGTDTDVALNPTFVKQKLAQLLNRQDKWTAFYQAQDNNIDPMLKHNLSSSSDDFNQFVTPAFIHALTTELRFEDFRFQSSTRLAILRAIHKTMPLKRLELTKALVDATILRYEYIIAKDQLVRARGVELTVSLQQLRSLENTSQDKTQNPTDLDTGHGFIEFLRYMIEHLPPHTNQSEDLNAQYQMLLRTFMTLWRTYWYDPQGHNEDELLNCASQFIAYVPTIAESLLSHFINTWPRSFPKMEVLAIRIVARTLMASPSIVQSNWSLVHRVFQQLAKCMTSMHLQVAQEAMAFTGCSFVLTTYVSQYIEIYKLLCQACHENVKNHWHEGIQESSDQQFERTLDYAPSND